MTADTELDAVDGNPFGISERALKRHGRVCLRVPNGRSVHGWLPGLSSITLTEHALRDQLATQMAGLTEAHLGYGRADVLTAETVFEVEHWTKWRTAVRQALQYSAQTGCQPAVALFGAGASKDDLLKIHRRLRDDQPPMELWWWRGDASGWLWCRISSNHEAIRTASMLARYGSGENAA